MSTCFALEKRSGFYRNRTDERYHPRSVDFCFHSKVMTSQRLDSIDVNKISIWTLLSTMFSIHKFDWWMDWWMNELKFKSTKDLKIMFTHDWRETWEIYQIFNNFYSNIVNKRTLLLIVLYIFTVGSSKMSVIVQIVNEKINDWSNGVGRFQICFLKDSIITLFFDYRWNRRLMVSHEQSSANFLNCGCVDCVCVEIRTFFDGQQETFQLERNYGWLQCVPSVVFHLHLLHGKLFC